MAKLTWQERRELAGEYAPSIVLFPELETTRRPGARTDYHFRGTIATSQARSSATGDYHPRGIGPLLERARITTPILWPQRQVTLDALAHCGPAFDQLTLVGKWFPDANLAWTSYFRILDRVDSTGQTGRDRYPVTIYARVLLREEISSKVEIGDAVDASRPVLSDEVGRPFFRPENARNDDVAIQYWFCYYFDDWANQHEGDWEGICLFLHRSGASYEPLGASYYAHESGTRRHWLDVERLGSSKSSPVVYVAAGSHASYFQFNNNGYVVNVPGLIIPILKIRLRVFYSSVVNDHVPNQVQHEAMRPHVELLPDPIGPDNRDDPIWRHRLWLSFAGNWGIRTPLPFAFGGPIGPSHKGLKWNNPFAWMERHCVPDFLVY